MDPYTQGFLEGLQAACIFAESKMRWHMDNAKNKELDEADMDCALACSMVMGGLSSDIQGLGAQIRRRELDPRKIPIANQDKTYWWAAEEGS